MRVGRMKIAPEVGEAAYHCMTRVVVGERLLDDPAKEVLRKQLRHPLCGALQVRADRALRPWAMYGGLLYRP